MKRSDIPFNISLLQLTPDKLKNMQPVKVLDIFDGSTTDFHPDGLFSTKIFGRVGDERRNYRFSYIDIKIGILHPMVYQTLVKMKHLYADILSGTDFARWSEEKSDFVRSNAAEGGQTGYEFFMKHWRMINFGETASITRDQGVRLLKKYGDHAVTDKVIVIPAGLRDLEVDEFNRRSEDEINSMYRRLLNFSNVINEHSAKTNPELHDGPRYRLQLEFNNIFEYILSMVEGKKKLMLGKFASRRIFNGTRNVITAMDTSVPYLGAPGNPGTNSTIVGLYQYLKATLPVSIYQIRQLLEGVFLDSSQPATLINKETLMPEEVLLHSKYYNQWATNEGIERVISRFSEESIRDDYLEIDGRYVFLLYRGPDGTFKLMRSIAELPQGRSVKDVRPVTFTEFLFLAVYKKANTYPCLVTRYPIAGVGSIYPSKAHLRVTQVFESRTRLDDNWLPMSEEDTAYEFPVRSAFVNSLIPHSVKLGNLTADFDGDTCSFVVLYSDEAIEGGESFLNERRSIVGTSGEFIDRVDVATVQYVLENMTGM